MRIALLLCFVVIFTGCVSQPPQPELPVRWAPQSPDKTLVIFNDDNAAGSLLRQDALPIHLKQHALNEVAEGGFEAVDGAEMTQAFLPGTGRRSENEVLDSLAMLDGWGYGLAQSFSIETQASDTYQKIWFSVDATLFDVRKQNVMQRWQQRSQKHMMVAADCDVQCIASAVLPQAEQVVSEVLQAALKRIAPKPAGEVIEPAPVVPVDDVPDAQTDKKDWHPINY
jgi:hypothetical protein